MGTGLQEYVYVSALKLAAFSSGRRRGPRLERVQVKAGPLAGDLVSSAPNDGLLRTLARVVDEIEATGDVHVVGHPDVAPGGWVRAEREAMVYGVPRTRDRAAVVFLGESAAPRLLLCGSAVHLLDRAPEVGVPPKMSAPDAVGDLVAEVREAEGDGRHPDPHARPQAPEPERILALAFAELSRTLFARMDPLPLSYLARVTRVVPRGERGPGYVLATPLYVAHAGLRS